MFRSVTAIVLICSIITANFTQLFIYSAFELNKEYIASVLCVNRDKPKLNCKGKCYLNKKIKQAEEKEKNQDQQSQKYHFQQAIISRQLMIYYPADLSMKPLTFERHFILQQYPPSVFHPPQV
jgi:hypothetical protein